VTRPHGEQRIVVGPLGPQAEDPEQIAHTPHSLVFELRRERPNEGVHDEQVLLLAEVQVVEGGKELLEAECDL